MITYELMLVIDPKAGESVVSLVSKSLNDAKAESVKVTKIGKKTLAYPIRKNLEAEFVLFSFAADGEAPKILSDILKVQREEVLRFLVVKTKEARVKKRRPAKEEEKVEVAVPKVTVKTVSKSKATSAVKKPREPFEKTQGKPKAAKAGKKEEKKVKSEKGNKKAGKKK